MLKIYLAESNGASSTFKEAVKDTLYGLQSLNGKGPVFTYSSIYAKDVEESDMIILVTAKDKLDRSGRVVIGKGLYTALMLHMRRGETLQHPFVVALEGDMLCLYRIHAVKVFPHDDWGEDWTRYAEVTVSSGSSLIGRMKSLYEWIDRWSALNKKVQVIPVATGIGKTTVVEVREPVLLLLATKLSKLMKG